MRVLRRSSLALLLALILCAPSSFAAEARRASPGSQGLGTAARLWSALVSLWSEAGCRLDPLGSCSPDHQGIAPADEGCRIDPLGRCSQGGLRSAPAEEGCEIDPLGRCFPDSQHPGLSAGGRRPAPADAGCEIDPLGCASSR